jgi:hypothetical protein
VGSFTPPQDHSIGHDCLEPKEKVIVYPSYPKEIRVSENLSLCSKECADSAFLKKEGWVGEDEISKLGKVRKYKVPQSLKYWLQSHKIIKEEDNGTL